VGPPDRDGLLVSLSIGDPAGPVAGQSISMTLRVPGDLGRSARDIQAAALRRCTEILGGEVALDDGACDRDGNVVRLQGGPVIRDGKRR